MRKIVFLVSGGGGTLKYFYHYSKLFPDTFKLDSVIADRECGAIQFAQQKKITNYTVNYSQSHTSELLDILQSNPPDLVITTFHKILNDKVLRYGKTKFINLHYSLLPAFGGMIGMKTVKAAKDNNCLIIGTTTHFVNEKLDGGKIINQIAFFPAWEHQSLETVYDTVFQAGCISLLTSILQLHYNFEVSEEISINGNRLFSSHNLPISQLNHSKIYSFIKNDTF